MRWQGSGGTKRPRKLAAGAASTAVWWHGPIGSPDVGSGVGPQGGSGPQPLVMSVSSHPRGGARPFGALKGLNRYLTSRLEDDPARDAAARLGGERLTGFGQGINATDLRPELAGVDELSDLDELGTARVANEVDRADVLAIGRWG
jgi:hypothetical protein